MMVARMAQFAAFFGGGGPQVRQNVNSGSMSPATRRRRTRPR
jgi:hypothetical protein